MKKLFAAVVVVCSVACEQSPNASLSSQVGNDATIARQHCLVSDRVASCFLEIEKDGSSELYTSEVDYGKLLLHPMLSDLNFEYKKMTVETYGEMVLANHPMTFFYNENTPEQISAFAAQSLNDFCDGSGFANGWWGSWGKCLAGTVGGAGGGALAGAAAGSALPGLGTVGGAVAGGVFGGLTGAAASCGSRATILYHFGKDVISRNESINC